METLARVVWKRKRNEVQRVEARETAVSRRESRREKISGRKNQESLFRRLREKTNAFG